MEIIRLLPGDDRSWSLMPEFFKRVRKFAEKYLPETNPVSILEDVQRRWYDNPLLTGYWLAFDAGGLPYAHMVSWISETYSIPYVFIYQAYVDKFSHLGKVAETVLGEIDQWAKTLNLALIEGHKITKFEMSTWRGADAWVRYLAKLGYTGIKARSVIACDLKVG